MHALVQDHAADQLHVVVAHAEHAPARLAHDGEGLGQQVVEGLALVEPPAVTRASARAAPASDLPCMPGSSSPMRATIGRIPLMTRAFLVPKILLRM